MTHTPGPWELDPNFNVRGAREEFIASPDGNTVAEYKANARLIAAAPDTFAACEALVAWADEVGWDNTGEPKEFEIARAAIAKAKGEKHATLATKG